MILFDLLIILSSLIAVFVNIPSGLLFAVSFLLGIGMVQLIGKKDRKYASIIYCILFLAGGTYMLACYLYMVGHDYEWLFAFDTYNSYIPRIEYFFSSNNHNLHEMLESIFEDYNFFARTSYSYYLYIIPWGFAIYNTGADLYLGLQTSTLFLYPFAGVVLYKLFLQYGFKKRKSYYHTLVICLFSIIFFYSSQILRDIHVLLCYLIAIYLSGKPNFSIVNLIGLVVVIIITCGFRIESGLFLSLCVPVYFFLSFQDSKVRISFAAVSVLVILAAYVIFKLYFEDMVMVIENNYEAYTENVSEGSGMVAAFQRIPIIGDLISIIFNMSQPMPCWGRMSPAGNLQYGGNVDNIMNFPRISAAFINVMAYVYIFTWLFFSKLRKKMKGRIAKPLKYQLFIALLFLYLQSAVISQRRLMGYYCILYILMFLINDSLSKKNKQNMMLMVTGVFAFLQVLGVLYLM